MKLSRIHISRRSQCYPSCAAIHNSDWPTCIATHCRDSEHFTRPFVRSKTGSMPTGQSLARPFGRLQQAEAIGKNVELMMRGSTSMVALGSRYNNIQPHSSQLRRLPLFINRHTTAIFYHYIHSSSFKASYALHTVSLTSIQQQQSHNIVSQRWHLTQRTSRVLPLMAKKSRSTLARLLSSRVLRRTLPRGR